MIPHWLDRKEALLPAPGLPSLRQSDILSRKAEEKNMAIGMEDR
jgi:hypothetical protein